MRTGLLFLIVNESVTLTEIFAETVVILLPVRWQTFIFTIYFTISGLIWWLLQLLNFFVYKIILGKLWSQIWMIFFALEMFQSDWTTSWFVLVIDDIFLMSIKYVLRFIYFYYYYFFNCSAESLLWKMLGQASKS